MDMTFKEGNYNIKAVSKKLGIRPGTLRAWERRYHVVAPLRNDSGHRLYSEEQVLKLQTIIEKINEGFTVKQAVESLELKGTSEWPYQETNHYIGQTARELTDALISFDEDKAQTILNQAYSMYSLDRVTIDLFLQVEKRLKEMDNLSMLDLHTQFMFQILGAKVKNVSLSLPFSASMPKALLLTYNGDAYSILLRVFSFYLKRKGVQVICLDGGIYEQDVELVLKSINPNLLILSATDPLFFDQAVEQAKKAVLEHGSINHAGIIGDAFNHLSDGNKKLYADFYIGKSRADWELWLEHLN